MTKISSLLGLFKYISEGCRGYFSNIDINQWLRAFSAHVLLFTLVYIIVGWLSPFKDSLADNLFIVAFLAICFTIWKLVNKPPVLDECVTGMILYKMEISLLNKIILLAGISLISIFVVPKLLEKEK